MRKQFTIKGPVRQVCIGNGRAFGSQHSFPWTNCIVKRLISFNKLLRSSLSTTTTTSTTTTSFQLFANIFYFPENPLKKRAKFLSSYIYLVIRQFVHLSVRITVRSYFHLLTVSFYICYLFCRISLVLIICTCCLY